MVQADSHKSGTDSARHRADNAVQTTHPRKLCTCAGSGRNRRARHRRLDRIRSRTSELALGPGLIVPARRLTTLTFLATLCGIRVLSCTTICTLSSAAGNWRKLDRALAKSRPVHRKHHRRLTRRALVLVHTIRQADMARDVVLWVSAHSGKVGNFSDRHAKYSSAGSTPCNTKIQPSPPAIRNPF